MITFLLLIFIFIFLLVLVNVFFWPKINVFTKQGHTTKVSVLIPARNEERNIENCLNSVLLNQDSLEEILVLDDGSTDDTSKIVTQVSKHNTLVKLITGSPVPSGWSGKSYACHQLSQSAKSELLLFLDADVILKQDAVVSLISEFRKRNLHLLSAWPKIIALDLPEKILMPMLNFVVFTLYPAPLSLRYPRPSLGLAHGACILVSKFSYTQLGGHESVKNQLFEDTRLAQTFRKHGFNTACLDGQALVEVRMYDSFKSIWRGFQKNIYPAFQRQINFVGFLIFHSLFIAPFLLLLFKPTREVVYMVSFVFLIRFTLAVRFKQSLLSILFHPLAEMFLLALALVSFYSFVFNGGVSWKDRSYSEANLL